MSCNRCAATAEGVAPTAGASHLEGNWAGHRAHPQYCKDCHGFLRADGGCTKCDGGGATLAAAKAPKSPKAGAANVAVPMRLSCGCARETTVPAGGEEWCTTHDDFANVVGPVATPAPAAATGVAVDDKVLPQTEYGQAAFNAQHNRRANPGAQAKVKDIGYSRVAMALRGVGVPRTPPSDHIRNMVWQYLDRCTCGAWISPRSPVCNNPRCGQKGKTMGITRPWPPGDVQWVFRKQDVGYEMGMAVPNPPAPKKTKAAATKSAAAPTPVTPPSPVVAPTSPVTPPPPAAAVSVDDYKAQVEQLAQEKYGLDANEFLPDDDWQEQIDSGETPEELVERVAEKYGLTAKDDLWAGADNDDTSDGWDISVEDTELFLEDLDAELKRRGLAELSDEEAEDWRKAVDSAASRGEGLKPEESADMIDRLRRMRESEGDDESTPGPFHVAFSSPGVDDVETAWNELAQQYADKYDRWPVKARLTFSEPVQVRMNNRRVLETDKITVSLFRSQQGNFCYSYYSSTGYPLDHLRDKVGDVAVGKITGIEIVTPEETLAKNKVKVQKLAQSIHPNAWPETRQLMQDKPESHADYGLNRVSMRSVFGDHVVKQLEEAFEQGLDFSYRSSGERRTRSLEVRRQPDGTVKAWYSSEYAECANGDYYLLLNPYTASFKETD